MGADNEVTPIPRLRRVFKDTKANLDALTGLVDGDLAYGTDTTVLYRQSGSGVTTWEAITTLTALPDFVHSENPGNANDADKGTAAGSYTKIKEILLDADLPVCRLKFDGIGLISQCQLRVYKNGVAEGTQYVTTTSWVTVSEDFYGWVATDLIQIYGFVSTPQAGREAHARNMRLCYSRVGDIAIAVTNQDP